MRGVILLAAGSSRRFGGDKRQHRLADLQKPMLNACIDNILEAELPLLIALRHDDYDLTDSLAEQYPLAHLLRCPDSALGMGYSLSSAIEQAKNLLFTGAAIALADMPYISPASYSAVAKRISPDGIVVPRYQQRSGHPVGFGLNFFVELAQIRGDSGAKNIWKQHHAQVEYLELDDIGILRDIDSPSDLPSP